MRKKIVCLLTTVLAVLLALGVAACAEQPEDTEQHVHTYDTTRWVHDEEYHWHPATCGHVLHTDDPPQEKAPHKMVDGVCEVCHYKAETAAHTHTFDDEHWRYVKGREPTCTTGGMEEQYCTYPGCDATGATRSVSKLGHAWQSVRSHDNFTHWYACSRCDVRNEEEAHVFSGTNNECSVCGLRLIATSGLGFEPSVDGKGYVLSSIEREKITNSDNETVTEIVVPDTYSGSPVVGVKKNLFMGTSSETGQQTPQANVMRTLLTSIVFLGENLERVEEYAFYGCINLARIHLPDSVSYVGEKAFGGTAFYDLQENWRDGMLYAGKCLLEVRGVSGDFTVEEGTRAIGAGAFSACTELETVELPVSLVSCEEDAFSGCAALKKFTLAGESEHFSVVSGILYDAAKSKIVCLPAAIEGAIELPGTLGRIAANLFEQKNGVTSITLGEGITRIGSWAFARMAQLREVTLPSTIEWIGQFAFADDKQLSSLTFPDDACEGWSKSRESSTLESGEGTAVLSGELSTPEAAARCFTQQGGMDYFWKRTV